MCTKCSGHMLIELSFSALHSEDYYRFLIACINTCLSFHGFFFLLLVFTLSFLKKNRRISKSETIYITSEILSFKWIKLRCNLSVCECSTISKQGLHRIKTWVKRKNCLILQEFLVVFWVHYIHKISRKIETCLLVL